MVMGPLQESAVILSGPPSPLLGTVRELFPGPLCCGGMVALSNLVHLDIKGVPCVVVNKRHGIHMLAHVCALPEVALVAPVQLVVGGVPFVVIGEGLGIRLLKLAGAPPEIMLLVGCMYVCVLRPMVRPVAHLLADQAVLNVGPPLLLHARVKAGILGFGLRPVDLLRL